MKKVKLGKYQHYKGKFYQVIGLGRVEADLSEVVVYKPLYKIKDLPQGTLWVRPIGNFTEDVEINGKMIPRFKYIGAI
jgi:hypothetical protein